ncbi:ornithine--oxo-acid transaminase [Rickettsiella grylli]|uniref:ornithine--oxo-acid transaminase n=1 Tax=Rickettsiella grylli TaxID=59196 RepID=UPI000B16FDEC|nr:ornithine--oxo-acid transaminase [Rickettsiella grylli]
MGKQRVLTDELPLSENHNLTNNFIEREQQYGATNYDPLPVVLSRGLGAELWDVSGKRYIDMMSAYSAVSHGHSHPRLVNVLTQQAQRVAICSRAFYSDKLGAFLKRICALTQMDCALPMNTGVEAVETAIKAARKWAYTVKKVAENQAEIIVCRGNFHGRTTTVVGMSSKPQYQYGFGPFASGFKLIEYGSATALSSAITPNTAAFLVEPIQGERGIIVPPHAYLKAVEKICRENNVLLILDEIQTGLGRTGRFLACEHENVKPDGLILGKALGGGLLPVSLFLSRRDVMQVFAPGDHGSTFGGNPLAATVALEALNVLIDENLIQRSKELGEYLLQNLLKITSPMIKEVRGQGLFIGVELDSRYAKGRDIVLKLLDQGLLSYETHDTVIRLAPPLVISKDQLDEALTLLKQVVSTYTIQISR